MISRQNRDSPSCPHFKPLAFYLEQNRRPELIVQHIKTEKTQLQDRQPYEDYKQVAPNNIRSTVKDNIAMSMVLVEQNEELISKIENIRKQIEDEQLKARIFTQNIAKNEKEIARLRQKKEELIQSPQNSLRMQSLNESTIPIKNSPANCTLNNTWINEFLNKEELESLWNAKRQRQSSKLTKAEPKVKCFTIDLSTHLHSAKQKQEKDKTQVKLSFSSVDQKEGKLRNDQPVERNKRSIVSVAQNGKSKTQRVDLKLSINPRSSGCNQGQKSRALNKAISTLRNAKKLKPNPQL